MDASNNSTHARTVDHQVEEKGPAQPGEEAGIFQRKPEPNERLPGNPAIEPEPVDNPHHERQHRGQVGNHQN